jgi:hypothetical protein
MGKCNVLSVVPMKTWQVRSLPHNFTSRFRSGRCACHVFQTSRHVNSLECED